MQFIASESFCPRFKREFHDVAACCATLLSLSPRFGTDYMLQRMVVSVSSVSFSASCIGKWMPRRADSFRGNGIFSHVLFTGGFGPQQLLNTLVYFSRIKTESRNAMNMALSH
jgi:hypothetical protein